MATRIIYATVANVMSAKLPGSNVNAYFNQLFYLKNK